MPNSRRLALAIEAVLTSAADTEDAERPPDHCQRGPQPLGALGHAVAITDNSRRVLTR